MRPIYKGYNIGYNIILNTPGFNSQIRLRNTLDKRRQHIRLYRSRRTGLYKEPTRFPGFKNGP